MTSDGSEFEDVLKNAQELGYAERNPAADIEGWDACRKIAILSSLAYGHHVDFEEDAIPRESRRSLPRISVMQRHLAQPSSFWPAVSGSGTSTMRWYARL